MGDRKEVGQNTDSGQAGIVGVISTLEHTRGLTAGRNCSPSADTGMVTHERFWTEFLGAPSSFKSYIPFPQHVRHADIAKLGQVCFSFHMSDHDCYGQPHVVDRQ